jgi:glyoxylase-like metal-dependent hydrolase (beta-lactamase superfamily II)
VTKPTQGPVKRIREGIHQLVLPFPEYERQEAYRLRQELEANPRVTKGLPYILPYLITSRGESMLLDCGWGTDDSYGALQEQMHDIGTEVGEVSKLAISHAHPDHCGLAGRIKRESGCDVVMHELESTFIMSRYREPDLILPEVIEWLGATGLEGDERDEIARGSMPARFLVDPVDPDHPVHGGEMIQVGDFAFEVIWTPGHSPGHICLYEPNFRLLLTGDHVLPSITPNVSIHPQQRENPLQDFFDSLRKIADLKVDRMLPAHEWDIDWFRKRVDELLRHHDDRLVEMREIVAKLGDATASDVAKRAAWNTGSYDTFPAFMKRAAIGEAQAHLKYLVGTARLKEYARDGVTYYQAA